MNGTMETMKKQVLVTGLRTNAEYHLGNYLGALMPMIKMANEKLGEDIQFNLFAPDLHSFTTPIDHEKFYRQTIDNIKLFVAAGFPIDHANANIYRQSRIPAHSELTWILSNFTGFGEMSRMVEFKEKSDKLSDERVSVALFSYPILMAADILLYSANWVPVGEDQRQHLEFTRDIALRFNNKFGNIFVVPEDLKNQQVYLKREAAPRIRSLRDPSQKMSKSVNDPTGTIFISDKPADIKKKVMSATTDNESSINFDWNKQPGITNLLQILALLTNRRQKDVNKEWEGNSNYSDLKKEVAEVIVEALENIQNSLLKVDEVKLIDDIEKCEFNMNSIAADKLLEVQNAIGLR